MKTAETKKSKAERKRGTKQSPTHKKKKKKKKEKRDEESRIACFNTFCCVRFQREKRAAEKNRNKQKEGEVVGENHKNEGRRRRKKARQGT